MDRNVIVMHPLTLKKFMPYLRKYGTIYAEHRHDWRRLDDITAYCRKCDLHGPVDSVLPRQGCRVREDEHQDWSANA